MKKRYYETAEMEIELFALEDVICASPGGGSQTGGGGNAGGDDEFDDDDF